MNYFNLSRVNPVQHCKIRNHLLWEFKQPFDYEKGMAIVVERVVQRGNMDDWLAIFNLYGYDAVREQIKHIPYLNDKDMNFVHLIFDIPLTDLKCYTKKRSADPHWIS